MRHSKLTLLSTSVRSLKELIRIGDNLNTLAIIGKCSHVLSVPEESSIEVFSKHISKNTGRPFLKVHWVNAFRKDTTKLTFSFSETNLNIMEVQNLEGRLTDITINPDLADIKIQYRREGIIPSNTVDGFINHSIKPFLM